MSRVKQITVTFVVSILLFIAGCGQQQVTVEELGSAFPITGTVNLDGRPMSAGTIKLVPVDKDWQPLEKLPIDEGSIENGRFQLNVSLGYKLVEIYGDDSESVPKRFKTEDESKAYVHHATEDVFAFNVQSN